MSLKADEMRAWVGCLACYNGGDLVGEWVDAGEAAVFVPCHVVDANGPHEEWWCLDTDGFPADTGEMSPMEATRLHTIVAGIESHHLDVDAVLHWWKRNNQTSFPEDWDRTVASAFEDEFYGEHESFKAYIQDQYEDAANRIDSETLRNNIDWDGVAECEAQGYDVERTGRGTVWIFNG